MRSSTGQVALHRDCRGTAMTEFVIVLPVFLVIFVGLVELGKYARMNVEIRGRAKVETLDAYFELQRGDAEDMRQLARGGTNLRGKQHLHPVVAGSQAVDQVNEHPPHREHGDGVNDLVRAYETRSYGGLTTGGHFGESSARVGFLTRLDQFSPVGVAPIVRKPTASLFGRDTRGLVLARELMVDRVRPPTGGGDCGSIVDRVSGSMNRALSASGARPMLAAGIRYGTITRQYPPDGETTKIMGELVQPEAYWNTLVGPQVFPENPNRQAALATLIARLGLQSCGRLPYTELPGIGTGGTEGTSDDIAGIGRGGEVNRRLNAAKGYELAVPDPYESGRDEEAGFRTPFRYRGSFMESDYGE